MYVPRTGFELLPRGSWTELATTRQLLFLTATMTPLGLPEAALNPEEALLYKSTLCEVVALDDPLQEWNPNNIDCEHATVAVFNLRIWIRCYFGFPLQDIDAVCIIMCRYFCPDFQVGRF